MVMRPMSLVTNSGATVPEAPVSGTVQLTPSPSPIARSLPFISTSSPRWITPSVSPVVIDRIANVPVEPSTTMVKFDGSTLNSFSIRARRATLMSDFATSSVTSAMRPFGQALMER